MMYYLGWISLTTAGILAGIGVFVWALRTGQFKDQGRARYLPLADRDIPSSTRDLRKDAKGLYVFALILEIGFLGMVGTVLLTWLHSGG